MRSNYKIDKQPLKGMSVKWLAKKSKVPESLLWKLSKDTTLMYKPTRSQKKKGGAGYREIDPPKKEFKRLLKRIAKVLSSTIKHHPAAHGGVPGRSSFTSARPHCGAKFIITRDIRACYPSITTNKLRRTFCKIGASSPFAAFLSSIMTVHGRIPQGGHLSSLAVNLYMLRMDDHFYRKAISKNANYGRLTDDFVISLKNCTTALILERELDNAIRHRGLQINERKRNKNGFLGGDRRKEIHSLIVNSRRGLKPKKEHIQKGLKLAENYARRCRCATLYDLPQLAYLRQRVTGMMYYFRQAEFSPSRHLRIIIERADKKVLSMVRQKSLYPHKNKWWLVHKSRNEPERLLSMWKKRLELSAVA